jgi:hypothetical protein
MIDLPVEVVPPLVFAQKHRETIPEICDGRTTSFEATQDSSLNLLGKLTVMRIGRLHELGYIRQGNTMFGEVQHFELI